MIDKYKYLAFISYKREDEKWAKWLQYKLEHYKIPTSIRKNNPALPEYLKPIFMDTTHLTGGVLEEVIKEALTSSRYLIVICSTQSAQSPWVYKEVQEFIDSGRERNIIPFIIDGEPNSKNTANECFPQNLRELSGERELLGININDNNGRNTAAIKVVARMIGVDFDSLWQRWGRERRNRRRWTFCISFFCIIVFFISVHTIFNKYQKMQRNQIRAVAYRATELVENKNICLACKILVEVLPDDRDFLKKPYISEAEAAMRLALSSNFKNIEEYTASVHSAIFSPDGRYILTAAKDMTIKLWYVDTGECIITFNGHTSAVNSATFSHDGKYILSASGYEIKLWETETGMCIRTFEGHTGWVKSAIFSPDGKYILSASWDNTIKIWNVEIGECIKTFERHTSWVNSATFSPDGKYIVSASGDETIKLWNTETRECIITFEGHTNAVNSATFSPNGKYIVSASKDETIKLWNSETGECIKTFEGHTSAVNSATFSPNGKYIVSASKDKTIKLWNVDIGECIITFEGHTSAVNSATFSPNGKYIVSTADDGKIKLWKFQSLQEIIEETRERFKDNPLTKEERIEYYLE